LTPMRATLRVGEPTTVGMQHRKGNL
jgi:hypothetical protein